MLEKLHELQLKPKTIDELKVALRTLWEELPQEHINKVLANFTKRLTAWLQMVVTLGICSKGPFPSQYAHLSTKNGSIQSHPHSLLLEIQNVQK